MGRNYSVMLVDDEEDVIRAIMHRIDWEEIGLSVPRYAHNGLEALEMAEEDAPDEPIELVLEEEPIDEKAPAETVSRPRVFLLLLFILFAVPLTLAAALILLIPTLLSLVLSAACIVAGCAGIVAAFSGFPVFADILIVLGCAIVALALGLLFLWLFIWFVGAVIGGLIRWVVQLGSQWCYKEVAA